MDILSREYIFIIYTLFSYKSNGFLKELVATSYIFLWFSWNCAPKAIEYVLNWFLLPVNELQNYALTHVE